MKPGATAFLARMLAAAAMALVACRAASAGELLLADGTRSEAKLGAASENGKLAFDAGGKRFTPEGRDLVRWGAFHSPHDAMLAVLDGGDLLTFSTAAVDGDELRLKSKPFGELRVPVGAVRGLVFQPPYEALVRDRLVDELTLWQAAKGEAEKDATLRAMLDNGDAVLGDLAALAADELTIDAAAGRVAVPIGRVRAVAFAATKPAGGKRGLRFVVGARDGSRIAAAEITATDAGFVLRTAWGGELALARDEVVAIETLGGRATYLSDLPVGGYKHVPYLATTWPLGVDRHVAGGRLRAAGNEHLKGLGMHAAASATYAVDKAYRRFEAEIAIDDSAFADEAETTARSRRPPRGSVIFRVYTDAGDGQWQLRHTSRTVRGGDKPTPIVVDLASAKRLSLIVDFADRADEWDRADWLDARFVE